MLRLLHGVALRNRAVKPPWAMRAEAIYWFARREWKLARLFWTTASE